VRLLLLSSPLLATTLSTSHAEPAPADVAAPAQSVAVNFGLIQPLVLRGANVEVDYRRGPLVIGYSHGWSLEFSGATVVGEAHDQHLRLHVPYSTGLGVGVEHRISAGLLVDARAEFKLHRFEPSLEDGAATTLRALPAYRTVTIGAGIYATWQPWRGSRAQPALAPIDLSASVRWWPNVWDSLGAYAYANATTGQMETMHAANIGFANTPLLANISVGYVFE
jgi:hypothetical protein